MSHFDISSKDFIQFCKNNDFNLTVTDFPNDQSFFVLTGKNGIGKSRFLQLIREYTVTVINQNYPNMIVRRLDYGEHDDEYDPDITDHPLVTQNVLEDFGSNYNNWKTLITNQSNQNNESSPNLKEFKNIFEYYYENTKEKDLISKSDDKEKKIYFDEFKKYYRRQILKKICYGSLKQLLMLNMRYQFDLVEINSKIENNAYGLEFPYKIEKINKGFVDKSDINKRIIFKCGNKKVDFKDLSPGERLILHLILLIKDAQIIKIGNIDTNINQVLLLDEPDSHCEANLAEIFINIIEAELVKKMEIQVIMTTHNYLTICKIDKEDLFIIQKKDDDDDDDDELEIKADTEKSLSFDILAKNIIELFNMSKQPIEVIDKTYRSICSDKNGIIISGKMYGNLLEDYIKKLLEIKKISLITKMIRLNLQTHEQGSVKFHYDKDNLTDYNLEELVEPLHVIWPKSDCNFAWDFMIFESINQSNKIVHLFQIKNSDDQNDLIETIGKHFLIIIRIFRRLFNDFYPKFNNDFIKHIEKKLVELKTNESSKNQLDKEYKQIISDRNKPDREDLALYDFKLYFVSSLSSLDKNFSVLLKNKTKLRIEALKFCQSKLKKLTLLYNFLKTLKESSCDKFTKWTNDDVKKKLNIIIIYLKNELLKNYFSDIMNDKFKNFLKSLNKPAFNNDSDFVSEEQIGNLINDTVTLIKTNKININTTKIKYRKIFQDFFTHFKELKKIEKMKNIKPLSLDDLGKFEKEKCVLIDKESLNHKSKFLKLKSKSNVN